MRVCRGSHRGPPVRAKPFRPYPRLDHDNQRGHCGTTIGQLWRLHGHMSKSCRIRGLCCKRSHADGWDCCRSLRQSLQKKANHWGRLGLEKAKGPDDCPTRRLPDPLGLSFTLSRMAERLSAPLWRAVSLPRASRSWSHPGDGAVHAGTASRSAVPSWRRARISASDGLSSWSVPSS